MNDDDINYLRMNRLLCSVCQSIARSDLIETLRAHRQHFQETLARCEIGITIQGEQFTPKVILDAYLSGEYAHVKLPERERLAKLGSLSPIAKLVFLTTLENLYEAAYRTANVLCILRREYGLHEPHIRLLCVLSEGLDAAGRYPVTF